MIHRYEELSPKMLDWIRRVEADTIRENRMLQTDGPMADYYRSHYPESWAMVQAEQADAT